MAGGRVLRDPDTDTWGPVLGSGSVRCPCSPCRRVGVGGPGRVTLRSGRPRREGPDAREDFAAASDPNCLSWRAWHGLKLGHLLSPDQGSLDTADPPSLAFLPCSTPLGPDGRRGPRSLHMPPWSPWVFMLLGSGWVCGARWGSWDRAPLSSPFSLLSPSPFPLSPLLTSLPSLPPMSGLSRNLGTPR